MSTRKVKVSIYRYNPEVDTKPYYKNYEVELDPLDTKLLNVLMRIKDFYDDSLSFRRSCRDVAFGIGVSRCENLRVLPQDSPRVLPEERIHGSHARPKHLYLVLFRFNGVSRVARFDRCPLEFLLI